jgi:hypothetical protein
MRWNETSPRDHTKMTTSTEESESGIRKKREKSHELEFIPDFQPTDQIPAGSYFAPFRAISIQNILTKILLNPRMPRNHTGQPYFHHPHTSCKLPFFSEEYT